MSGADEFGEIARLFRPLTGGAPGAFHLLDDAAVNVEQWIAEEVQVVFAEQEGAAFVNGDGVTKPLGFMTPPKIAQANWIWGRLGYVVTGLSAGFNTTNGSDALIDLIYAVKAGYRQSGSFVMNRKTQAAIRKLKATTGEYFVAASGRAGPARHLDEFPARRGRGHARYCRGQFLGRLRQFRPRLSDRRPDRHSGVA